MEKKMENGKFVVKVYHIYPAWGMGQLSGAVVCNDGDEAHEIAYEIKEDNVNTKVVEMTGNFENELWKEWAEDIDLLAKYNHYEVDGLNITTAEEYYEKGFEFVRPDFDDMVYSEDGEFIGWYDAFKDAIVDAKENIIFKFNEERELVDNDGKVIGYFDDDGNFVRKKEGGK